MSAAIRRLLLLLLLLLCVGYLVGDVRDRLGAGTEVSGSLPAACRAMPAPPGPEDIALDSVSGFAIISATDRRALRAGEPWVVGGLWLLDARDRDARPVPLRGTLPPVFRPHGLSLFRAEGLLYAHVVNHLEQGHSVELFRIDPDTASLDHQATFSGTALISPNDVASVDTRRFYVTNDHGSGGGAARLMEDLLGLNRANLLYHDGDRFVEVVAGLTYANGVALSADGSRVFVTETLDRTLRGFLREPLSGRLGPELLVTLDAGPDNIDVAPDGSLWVTAHPDMLAFLAHAGDPASRSPSVVYRVVPDADSGSVARVLVDDGRRFSGGSVAAHADDLTLLGGVFDPVILRCTGRPEALGPPLPPPRGMDLPEG